MFKKQWLLSLVGISLGWGFSPSVANAFTLTSSIAEERFNQLTQGINISHWFAQGYTTEPYHLKHFIRANDIQLIDSLGFRHIRLPLDPNLLFNEANPEVLNAENLAYFDRALDLILQQDLAIIVNLHPEGLFKERLATDDHFVASVSQFWQALAQHLSVRNPDQVFLEVLNEPHFNWFLPEQGFTRWQSVQDQLLAAMRRGAPEHTLIATSHDWSNIDGLLALTPLADANIVYNFHFYEPMPFTHQGATWVEGFAEIANLQYPPTPDNCATVLATLQGLSYEYVERYCAQEWNADRIDARIGQVAAWAQHHNVRVTANEFGVYEHLVRPEDRVAWLRDTRTALEKYGIGWAMWDYTGGFRIVEREQREIQVDWEVVAALGFRTPSTENNRPRHVPEPSVVMGVLAIAIVLYRKQASLR